MICFPLIFNPPFGHMSNRFLKQHLITIEKMTQLFCGVIFSIFLTLVSGFAIEPSSDMKIQKEVNSPQADIIIEHYTSDTEGPDGIRHQIWLSPYNHRGDRVLLFAHGRSADVIFSPNEEWLTINDYPTSDFAFVYLFKRIKKFDLQYSEVKGANVSEKVFKFFAKQNGLSKVPEMHHQYVNVLQWASDSQSFLVLVRGYGDSGDYIHYIDNGICLFSVDTFQPSFDFKKMNRDVFGRKKR